MRPSQVRAADVVADPATRLVCYMLSRADFDRLLGSKDEIWRFEALQNVRDTSVCVCVCVRARVCICLSLSPFTSPQTLAPDFI